MNGKKNDSLMSRHRLPHSAALLHADAVARFGSIREAARHLNISSSAVTRQIRLLEETLGFEVFERASDGMRPTYAGELIVAHFRNTLQDLGRTISKIEASRGTRHGLITIATTDSLATSILPYIILDHLESNPAARFDIAIRSATRSAGRLTSGKAEVALTFEPVDYSGLCLLHREFLPLGVIASRGHPLAIRERVTAQDVLKYPTILPSGDFEITKQIEAYLHRLNPNFEAWIYTDSFDLMKSMVETGRFLAFRTVLALENVSDRRDLVFLPLIEEGFPVDNLALLSRPENELSDPAKAFCRTAVRFLELLEGRTNPKGRCLSGLLPRAFSGLAGY